MSREGKKICTAIRSLAVELRRISDDYLRDHFTTETYLKALARIIEDYKRLVETWDYDQKALVREWARRALREG